MIGAGIVLFILIRVKNRKTPTGTCTFADGDGKNELVIGYSDRRVRSYRWQESTADSLMNSSSSGGSAVGSSALSGGKFVHVESWRLEGQVSLEDRLFLKFTLN